VAILSAARAPPGCWRAIASSTQRPDGPSSVLDFRVSTLFDFVWLDPSLSRRSATEDWVIGKRVKIPRGPRHCDRGRPGQRNH
jgi:hypothetical protein